ncbi:recombinase family protein [Siccirubricoccus sp. KC 17139]|uniref:Recombinase family protein n=1 Tax=Siccirubricoccus soli TaxID=2899147 RepID=A0ABT1D3Y8_9PROT|nr:recombinase family protein [Siccirubricoccus soli]MCO6415695.1 recombinase family protein [Siccirubricoccus soli]MCP2681827.1 recombinase family protein [Siccirubricoccus soli]
MPRGQLKRAALYLRVSTDGQTVENQRMVLLEVAERRGWPVVAIYEDAGISGAGGRDKRPGFDRMLKDAARRRFDVLMVAAVDRLGRSTATVSVALAELAAAGVEPYSHREGMDGTTAYGRAMLNMASVFAELERDLIRDRVKAGLARAKAQGRRLGRPTISGATEAEIRAQLAAGTGVLKVARTLGVGVSTVQRVKGTAAAAATL